MIKRIRINSRRCGYKEISAAALFIASAPWTTAVDAQSNLAITPTPRSINVRADFIAVTRQVSIIARDDVDSAALALTEQVIGAAGATDVVRTQTGDRRNLTIYVGLPSADPAVAAALAALRISSASTLPAEGYIVGIGRCSDGANCIVLAGADAAGTFYAAQTLRQIIQAPSAATTTLSTQTPWLDRLSQYVGGHRLGSKTVRGVVVRDWPAFHVRGVVEGFFGNPWSQADRLDQLDFYGRHKLNTYIYAAKNEDLRNTTWRIP